LESRAQSEMAQLVRTILAGTKEEALIETLLTNTPSLIPCDCAALSILHPEALADGAITHTRADTSGPTFEIRKFVSTFSKEEVRRLVSAGDALVVQSDAEFPVYLSRWAGDRPATFVVDPAGIVRYARISRHQMDPAPFSEILAAATDADADPCADMRRQEEPQ